MKRELETILVSGRLEDINITIEGLKNDGTRQQITIDMETYIYLFGYGDEFFWCERNTLTEEFLTQSDRDSGVVFTKAWVGRYDYQDDINFGTLSKICYYLYDCESDYDRSIVVDYFAYVPNIEDELTLSEIKSLVAYANMDEMIESLKNNCELDEHSELYPCIDFEQYARNIALRDYYQTPNGFIFHLNESEWGL